MFSWTALMSSYVAAKVPLAARNETKTPPWLTFFDLQRSFATSKLFVEGANTFFWGGGRETFGKRLIRAIGGGRHFGAMQQRCWRHSSMQENFFSNRFKSELSQCHATAVAAAAAAPDFIAAMIADDCCPFTHSLTLSHTRTRTHAQTHTRTCTREHSHTHSHLRHHSPLPPSLPRALLS